jgi:hypothetical protein
VVLLTTVQAPTYPVHVYTVVTVGETLMDEEVPPPFDQE